MTADEVREYVRHRLKVAGLTRDVFSGDALDAICQFAHGVPRLVNSICERCMLGAYAQGGRTIDVSLARRSAREVLGTWRPERAWPRYASVAAVMFACAIVLAYLALDPLDQKIWPALTEAGWAERARDEIKTWPVIDRLFQPASESKPAESSPPVLPQPAE